MTESLDAIVLAFSTVLLWFVARWSSCQAHHRLWLVASGAVVLACVSLVLYSRFFSAPLSAWQRTEVELFFLYVLIPLFCSLPIAVVVLVSQVLASNGSRGTLRQALSFGAGFVTLLLLPFAALAAGCGLIGACL